jgi:hypothetical protein
MYVIQGESFSVVQLIKLHSGITDRASLISMVYSFSAVQLTGLFCTVTDTASL